MSTDQPTVAVLKSRLMHIARFRPDDVEALEAARRDLAAAVLAKRIKAIVAKAPPLTTAQKETLALLLGRDSKEAK